jgi:uncharacterized protein (DUF4415 family)
MNKRDGDPVSPELLAQLEQLEAKTDEDIDLSDMPETLDWSRAVEGKYYRPIEKPHSLRLDEDVVAWFRSKGDRCQTRMNAALRDEALFEGCEDRRHG